MDFTHPPLRLFEQIGSFFGYHPQSRRLQTAYQVLEGYKTLRLEEILRPLDDHTFTQQVLPMSLGMPSRSKSEFTKHAAGITSIFTSFRMEPQAVFEDEVQNAVVIYAKMVGELTRDLGPWENECVMMMKFSRDGRRVVEHREFVDSAKAKLMGEKLAPKDFGVK